MIKIIRYQVSIAIILFLMPCVGIAQQKNGPLLTRVIKAIADSSGAKIGVSVKGLDAPTDFGYNNYLHFPMQSTFKFPLAVAILHGVDQGKLRLNQQVHIRKEELNAQTWSPLVKKYPNQDINISLSELLMYSVSKSDNNACDVLFHLAGGTGVVNSYVHSIGVKNISIKATEEGMRKAWDVQYTNWSTPDAMAQLLELFFRHKLLSKSGNDFLMKLMTESENSPNRIKGNLPANTVVAHKTGTSDTNKQGITAATNDVGIVTLPNGKHYAIAVFVSDYKGGTVKGERIIAAISKLVWDWQTGK